MISARPIAILALCVSCGAGPVAPAPSPSATLSASASASASVAPQPAPEAAPELTEAEIEELMQTWREILPNMRTELYAAGDDEMRWYLRSCLDFVRPLMLGVREARDAGKDPADMGAVMVSVYEELQRQGVGSLTPQTIKRCANETIRSVRAYQVGVRLSRPHSYLTNIGYAMKLAYEQRKRLCPGTDAPVPSKWDDAQRMFVAQPKDYEAPAWKCLLVEPGGGESRFQFTLEVDEEAGTFVAKAVGSVNADEHEQTYTVKGRVADGEVVYDEAPSGPTAREIVKGHVAIP